MSKKDKKTGKKTLLSEAVVRQWSKLVGTPLTNERLEQLGYNLKEDDELEDEEGLEEPAGDLPPPEGEMDMEPEAPAPAAGSEQLVQDLVSAIASAIQDVSGVSVEVEGGAEDPAGDLPPPEGEMEMEPEEEEEPMMEKKEEVVESDKKEVKEEEKKVEEKKEEVVEDGRGKSGDAVEVDRKPRGSGVSSLAEKTKVTEKMISEIAKRVSERLLKRNK